MKISKLFHWLYCLVMFLPVLFIPIMAIYSHRHTIDNYSVVRSEPIVTDYSYYQIVPNGLPIMLDIDNDAYLPNWELDRDDNYYIVGDDYQSNNYVAINSINSYISIYGIFDHYNIFNTGDKLYLSCNCLTWDDITLSFYITGFDNDNSEYYLLEGDNCIEPEGNSDFIDTIYTFSDTVRLIEYRFDISDDLETNVPYYFFFKHFQLFNLTSIFGSGNEPDINTCRSIFSSSYHQYNTRYVYTETRYVNVTYNDTDIGSQFVYDTYNVVDKYFNYDNVLSIGDLYLWCEINLFNGNATLGFFIFFHLLEYWLLTSLLWLIFDILIYVPQLCHRWLDKASLE